MRQNWHETGDLYLLQWFEETAEGIIECCYGDRTTEDEISEAYDMYGRDEKCIRNFDWYIRRKIWKNMAKTGG